MEVLGLEGSLLQRSLNEGRKLLRERDDLRNEVQVLNDRIKDLEAEKCKLEIRNNDRLYETMCVKNEMWDILLEINTLKKENRDLKKQLASREEHTP